MIRAAAVIALLLAAALPSTAVAQERNPPPVFKKTGHKLPETTQPPARWPTMEYVDVAVLAAALGAASYLAVKRRSRRALFVLMLASLAYLGFYRQGCVCPIGAIQNVTLAIFDPTYAIPLAAVAFFVLPLAATLFAGRTFCGAVCPLGAVQDVVTLHPVKVPTWLEHALGLLPFVYLTAGVLLAATGARFLICEYDPFVGFFRLSGSLQMILLGGIMLLIGVFVARPYCRFLCPYGAVLRILSRISWRHVTVTPDECIKCRLCEDSCPFGAINKPAPPMPPRHRLAGKVALAVTICLLPILVVLGGWGAKFLAPALSRAHWKVALAQQVWSEEADKAKATAAGASDEAIGKLEGRTNETKNFRNSGQSLEELLAEEKAVTSRFATGLWWAGAFLGLVIGTKLIYVSVRRTSADYEPDRARCVSCGRCFLYCPKEHVRLRKLRGTEPPKP
ncbi:MAG: 4Fe-4S binding protein [Phycisphaerae bacterium]